MSVRTGESQIKWYVQLIQPRHRNKTCTCSTATEVMVLRCVIGCSQKIEPGDQVTRRLFVSLCWVDHPLTALRVSGGQSVYKLDLRRSVTGFTCRLLLTQKDWACMQFSLVRWQVFFPLLSRPLHQVWQWVFCYDCSFDIIIRRQCHQSTYSDGLSVSSAQLYMWHEWALFLESSRVRNIVFVCCPVHAGVSGNERANRLASIAPLAGAITIYAEEIVKKI